MSTKNGAQTQVAIATPPASELSQALAILLQRSGQQTEILHTIAQELSVMNRQMFNAGAPAVPPAPQPAAPAAPVAAVVAQPQPQTQTQANGRQLNRTYSGICDRIGITRTRSLGKTKVNFYIQGERYPVYCKSDNPGEMIRFLAQVCPILTLDHFNDQVYATKTAELQASIRAAMQQSSGGGRELDVRYEEQINLVEENLEPFVVEWHYYRSQSDGKIYNNVDRVYPRPAGQ